MADYAILAREIQRDTCDIPRDQLQVRRYPCLSILVCTIVAVGAIALLVADDFIQPVNDLINLFW